MRSRPVRRDDVDDDAARARTVVRAPRTRAVKAGSGFSTVLGALKLQLNVTRSDPELFAPLITVPLLTIAFLSIFRHAGRDDLATFGLLAPVLITMWSLSLYNSAEIIDADRWHGVLEPAVAAPASLATVVVSRIVAVTTVSFVSFFEVLGVGRFLFGIDVSVHHPGVFAATLVVTIVALSGTALLMAALFVLTRSVRTFQNSLSYPFYVLSGVVFPVSVLPNALEPLSGAVFLSWVAGLLRDSFEVAPVDAAARRVAIALGLGVAGFAVGAAVLARILRHLRKTGTLGLV